MPDPLVPRYIFPMSLLLALTATCPHLLVESDSGRDMLDKLARAKYVSFEVTVETAYVSLPDDPVIKTRLKGRIIYENSGRWRWSKPDGWDILFDGKAYFRTAMGSAWREPCRPFDLLGEPLDSTALRKLLIGLGPFFNGRWKGVKGEQDWIVVHLGQTDRMGIGQPKSASDISDTRAGVMAAASYLYFDPKTLTPLNAEYWDSQSQDRTEQRVTYIDFQFDPPGAVDLLKSV